MQPSHVPTQNMNTQPYQYPVVVGVPVQEAATNNSTGVPLATAGQTASNPSPNVDYEKQQQRIPQQNQYPPAVPAPQQQSQVVQQQRVVQPTGPNMVPTIVALSPPLALGRYSQGINCPICGQSVVTRVRYVSSSKLRPHVMSINMFIRCACRYNTSLDYSPCAAPDGFASLEFGHCTCPQPLCLTHCAAILTFINEVLCAAAFCRSV